MPTTHLACFTEFSQPTAHLKIPAEFTYPFAYQANPLAKLAAQELQQKLPHFHPENSTNQGRMYGVLVVKSPEGKLGYLTAISGNIDTKTDKNSDIAFVPNIVDGFASDEKQQQIHQHVNQINHEIAALENSAKYQYATQLLHAEKQCADVQIVKRQQTNIDNKVMRKELRRQLQLAEAQNTLSAEHIKQQSIELSRQSVFDKKALAELKTYWQQRIEIAQANYDTLHQQLSGLKKRRRQLSHKLQKWLFEQYQLLNAKGETKDVLTLFKGTVIPKPPAGSGDCAAPKLLQYAFLHQFTPICMAEFWWGNAPKSEVRKHLQFYPACQGKCLPILNHMLEGLTVEKNPLLENPAADLPLPIVYQDEHIVVVNKPSGLLSVPGKTIQDSVYQRIIEQNPDATGHLILHRLDMATSGLLVLALSTRAHKHIQKQFISKVVQKRYVALIDGVIEQQQGEITLPLTLDFYDRPRQMVCVETGKPAHTKWQKLAEEHGQTRLLLYPITGRTHQLRVHCAHAEGLNTPIVGDDLYGTPDDRLKLHAQRLSFLHPISQQRMTFEVEPDF
ncbi:RNA pseudouridine synthase [Thalassotalea marina]|uniref:RNA pseudouridine synthase n=2 Tax=Thalassotalea marina TaxID=1673741 RepID=A0A919BLE8_9GAMM|nr:RNA pseudouridine synthase [Thalassotalea marina]